MITYVDASVLIRVVLDEPNPLLEWRGILGVTSRLTRVEAFRTLHRQFVSGRMTTSDFDEVWLRGVTILSRMETRGLTQETLSVASRAFPVALGTLDSIHLATAIIYRDRQPDDERPIRFATHDLELARAAAALRFDVIGV